MYIRHQNPISKAVFFSDFAVLNAALIIAHYLLVSYPVFDDKSKIFFIVSNISWFVISFWNKNLRLIETKDVNDIVNSFFRSIICQLVLVFCTIYLFQLIHISKVVVIMSFALFFLFVITHRMLLMMFFEKSSLKNIKQENVIVIGDKSIADTLINALNKHCTYDFKTGNYFSEEYIKLLSQKALFKNLLELAPDEIFVCNSNVSIDFIEPLIAFGNEHDIKIKVVYAKLKDIRSNILNYKHAPITHINSKYINERKVRILKRFFDVTFSMTVMTLGMPVYIILYITTKFSSKGPVIYKQERIGKNEKPFYIYKFRSMYVDAEKFGPQLAKENDPRVTKWGLVMRKTRLDELPQFWNVLKGDMSIVGHRPERRHFIDEISKRTPQYKKLLVAKPGVTSLGQVQYGYAENIDQMCERLNYDLLYAQNVTLNFDVNIILKTVRVMVEGRGK